LNEVVFGETLDVQDQIRWQCQKVMAFKGRPEFLYTGSDTVARWVWVG
jgi:hypothetical protein